MSIFWIAAGAALLVALGWVWGREVGQRQLGALMALILLSNGYRLRGLYLDACVGGDEQAKALQKLITLVHERGGFEEAE